MEMKKEVLYREFAKYYDLIYGSKKYENETKFINAIVKKNKVLGKKLLDIACGTGSHSKSLIKSGYTVTGIDKHSSMLKIAKSKVPQAKFMQGDMKNFSLNKKFDVILCLFTSLNYNLTKKDLLKSIKNFKRHLKEDGILILDCPLFDPKEDKAQAFPVMTREGKVIPLYDFETSENLRLKITIFWLIPKGSGYRVIKDRHFLQGYTLTEYKEVAKKAGLRCKLYWDFSLTKQKGKRPQLVCKNP